MLDCGFTELKQHGCAAGTRTRDPGPAPADNMGVEPTSRRPPVVTTHPHTMHRIMKSVGRATRGRTPPGVMRALHAPVRAVETLPTFDASTERPVEDDTQSGLGTSRIGEGVRPGFEPGTSVPVPRIKRGNRSHRTGSRTRIQLPAHHGEGNINVLPLQGLLQLSNESRLSCGAPKKDSFHNLRAPPASSAC